MKIFILVHFIALAFFTVSCQNTGESDCISKDKWQVLMEGINKSETEKKEFGKYGSGPGIDRLPVGKNGKPMFPCDNGTSR